MSKKNLYILLGIIVTLTVLLLIAIGGYLILSRTATNTNTVVNNTNTTANTTVDNSTTTNTTTNTTDNSTDTNTNKTFDNDYMSFTYPNNWTVAESTASAINIVSGHYILFINTQAQQASGVTGGRFAEISMGAPGSDLVIKTQPSNPCGTSETSSPFSGYETQTRVDLYVSNAETSENCTVPSNGNNVWYFSYITNASNHYFNYYVDGQTKAYVITMTYNTNDVNNLPVKGSSELNTMLSQMTDIVKTLTIKQK